MLRPHPAAPRVTFPNAGAAQSSYARRGCSSGRRSGYVPHIGYDLHITRAEDWGDSAEAPITPDEWKAYVDAAPDLEWEPERPWTHMEVDLAVWTAHPTPDAWLALLDGQIETKNPDAPMRTKMYEIATALGARVQGDDGEFYDARGEPSPGD
jgi:hypothetical protein